MIKTKDQKTENAILNCIKEIEISDQNELMIELSKRGFHIPQPTLSRKLHKLGISKVNNIYKHTDSIKENIVLSIAESPPNLLVIRTLPGHANSIAYQLDKKIDTNEEKDETQLFAHLIGTIAGDDTLLLICDGKKQSLKKLKEDVEFAFFKND